MNHLLHKTNETSDVIQKYCSKCQYDWDKNQTYTCTGKLKNLHFDGGTFFLFDALGFIFQSGRGQ